MVVRCLRSRRRLHPCPAAAVRAIEAGGGAKGGTRTPVNCCGGYSYLDPAKAWLVRKGTV
jgi:hypothetical protein